MFLANLLQAQFESHSLLGLCLRVFITFITVYVLSTTVYSLYLSPLSAYPGPKLYALSNIPIVRHRVKGSAVKRLQSLHAQYGPIVRIGPSELSYIEAQAWHDIYGPKNASIGRQMPKDPAFYQLDPSRDAVSVLSDLDDGSHDRQRKVFAHAFSERALRQQEPLIAEYVDKLVERLKQVAHSNETVDMVRMLNFTTFDIMSDLAFGAPLDLLKLNSYHEWVSAVFGNLHAMAVLMSFLRFPIFRFSFQNLLPPSLKAQREKHHRFTRDKVDTRLAESSTRPDIWSLVMAANAASPDVSEHVKLDEMYDNAGLFMIAGTETSATLLSGLLYLLLTHGEQMEKLKREVRALPESQLSMGDLPRLEYLRACIEEASRIYPPVPGGLPRKTPKGGAMICDRHVPGDTIVAVSQHAAYHSPSNFSNPDVFAPERWLAPSEPKTSYAQDKRKVLNPFSVGPRNCLGQNLAQHEIRLIIAKLIWNFDFELLNEDGLWMDQRVLLLWEKKPLMVKVLPVKG